MPSTKTIDTTARFFSIFKGPPGTGKTRAAASFPAPYFFDFDGRMSIVKTIFPDKDVQYDSFYRDFSGAMRKLEALTNHCPYGTIVCDSLTSLCRTALGHMIKYRGSDEKKLMKGGLEVSQMGDYGGETAALIQMTDAFHAINDKGVKIIVIAHVVETETKDIKTGEISSSRQLMTGGKKIAVEMAGYYDAFHFYTTTGFSGAPEYEVLTKNAGDDWAKVSFDLPRKITWTDKDFYQVLLGLLPSLDRTPTPKPVAPVKGGF
jgi:hypothetical protein